MYEKRFEVISTAYGHPRGWNDGIERVTDLFLDTGGLVVFWILEGTGLFAEAFSRHGLEVAGGRQPGMLIAARRYVPKG